MTQTIELYLHQTEEYPCSYLSGKTARSQMIQPSQDVDEHMYSQLIDHGFRRSGLLVYRPSCSQCQACQSMRVVNQKFEPNRSQRRTFKKWQHLTSHIRELEFDPEHFALYQTYQQSRHSEGDMAQDDIDQYKQFIVQSQVNSFLVEFRTPENQLMMVSLIDRVEQGLSAVYTFYQPNTAGLGTYGVLWQISVAKSLSLPYVYLGFWIKDSAKMAYKANFNATQTLQNGVWLPHLPD